MTLWCATATYVWIFLELLQASQVENIIVLPCHCFTVLSVIYEIYHCLYVTKIWKFSKKNLEFQLKQLNCFIVCYNLVNFKLFSSLPFSSFLGSWESLGEEPLFLLNSIRILYFYSSLDNHHNIFFFLSSFYQGVSKL